MEPRSLALCYADVEAGGAAGAAMWYFYGPMESLLSGVNWLASLVMALGLSIVANLLTPWVKDRWSQRSLVKRQARIKELQTELEVAERLAKDPQSLTNKLLTSIVRILFLSSAATAIGAMTALPSLAMGMLLDRTDPRMMFLSQAYLGLGTGMSSVCYLMAALMALEAVRTARRADRIEAFRDSIGLRIRELERAKPAGGITTS